jgi:hypothetical protein
LSTASWASTILARARSTFPIARHGSVEPVLDLRVGAAALGSLEQPLGLLEREVGLVQPRIGGTGNADPESEHQRCDRRDDDQ